MLWSYISGQGNKYPHGRCRMARKSSLNLEHGMNQIEVSSPEAHGYGCQPPSPDERAAICPTPPMALASEPLPVWST